jgi:hypothetical protein
MGAKSDYTQGIEKSDSTDANTNTNADRNKVDSDDTPPIYYDAEPSAQPPSYPNNQSTSPTELQKGPRQDPSPQIYTALAHPQVPSRRSLVLNIPI